MAFLGCGWSCRHAPALEEQPGVRPNVPDDSCSAGISFALQKAPRRQREIVLVLEAGGLGGTSLRALVGARSDMRLSISRAVTALLARTAHRDFGPPSWAEELGPASVKLLLNPVLEKESGIGRHDGAPATESGS
jgi:hypothetical protein